VARITAGADSLTKEWPGPPPPAAAERIPGPSEELRHQLLWIILGRAIITILGLNLAGPLELLPEYLGQFPFVPLFNILTITVSALYLGLWRSGRQLSLQLYLQIAVDLAFTTFLVASTSGIESAFVSFYLLIIIYSSLTLGRIGGMISAALSVILYTGLITAGYFLKQRPDPGTELPLAFRISFHAMGFFSVASLGTYLSYRLRAVQRELEEKTDSLRQLETLNEHIVRSIRSGLVTTDLEGRITVFNNAAEEMSGMEYSDMLGSRVQTLIGEELWQEIQTANLLKDVRPLRHEAWISLPENRKGYLGFSISPLLDQSSRLIGYIISFQDLTEIKRLEEEIRVKDRMAAIGRIAAGIAHEIRNPLTSMRGSVEVLRSHLILPERDARLMDILIRESDRLNTFVEEFLQFAKPARYTREPVELVSLLRDTATLLQNSPEVRQKHSIELNLELRGVTVMGNPSQLQQVFWNLAQNALRAMPAGGTLTIRAHDSEDGGAKVVFEDTGVGMTREEQEQLFQPFHSKFAHGTGLGLTIVFQIVEDHNGRISFESEKGRGTKVTLSLPYESGKPAYVQ
jgi:two-component system sensor histidine kinase PilS (NtrC family)